MALAGHDTANLVFNSTATASSYSGTLTGVVAGELIVVCATACAETGGTTPSGWTVTLGSDTLTFREGPAPGGVFGVAAIFTGVASASGDQTLTVSPGGNLRSCTAHAFRITGFDTTTRIANSGAASSYGSDVSALAGPNGVTTAADGNAIIGCIGVKGGDTTALAVGAADGSTVGQSGANATSDHEWGVAWDRTPTAASVTFAWTWSSNADRPGLAWVEIAEASGGSIGSGAGAATGAGTAIGTGAATASASGSSTGSATAAATGASTAASAGAASGAGAATSAGAATAAASGAAAGTGAASATGASIAAATGAAAGASTVTAYSGAGSAGSAAGTSTATGTGAAVIASAGAASGVAAGSAAGASVFAASGAASGAASAAAVGRSFAAAVAVAGGSGMVLGAGAATLAAVASAAGSAVASGITGAVQQISNIIMASRRLPAFRAVGGRGGIRAIGGGR